MNRFLLIFHDDLTTKALQPSPDQLPASLQGWKHWFRQMAVQNQLALIMIGPTENSEDATKAADPEIPQC